MTDITHHCVLCVEIGGSLLWQDEFCRIVLAEEVGYPGSCRVILNRHIKEMTDLSETDQRRLFSVVMAVEKAVRHVLAPDKINLASLGNMVPHLHWHVIPRYVDDAHFPGPIWGEAKREGRPRVDSTAMEKELRETIRHGLS